MYATGIGTVGKLKVCLYVPNMNVNLISDMHVLDDIPIVSVTFEKPNGIDICFIRHKLQQFEEVVCKTKNRLVEVTNFQWLGLDGRRGTAGTILCQGQQTSSKLLQRHCYTRYGREDSDAYEGEGS